MSKYKRFLAIPVTILMILVGTAPSFARTVQFAGRQWQVKTGTGGPGPNFWSDSQQSVWVDASGRLHLKIRKVNSVWYCAEVYSDAPTRYGMHRFYTEGAIDDFDRNVVFSPFLYRNDNSEVDIEFAKWGIQSPSTNGQYVVQPWSTSGNREKFSFELSGTFTTHYIDWHSSWIRFKSIHGHYQEPPNSNFLIHEWLYTGSDIPSESEDLSIHINLWLYQGLAPSDQSEVEVVISKADLRTCSLPGTPSYVSPSDGATNQTQPVRLDWGIVSGANYYQIQVDNNSNFSSPEKDAQPSSSYYDASSLADGTRYWWRVRAHNSCGWGNWNSGTWDFTTSCPLPGTPSYVSPLDGVPVPQTVRLDWGSVSGADIYQVQVDNNSSFSSPERDLQRSSSYYDVSGLAKDVRYYWRVRAHNACGWGPWNNSPSPWSFVTSVVSVEEIEYPELPKNFALYQNYPNPFNPETRIEFSIPRRSFVTIEVFNILGTRVRLLVNERLSAGHKVVTWDSKDENGEVVSSGIYIYRIIADDFVQSKKMMLMK